MRLSHCLKKMGIAATGAERMVIYADEQIHTYPCWVGGKTRRGPWIQTLVGGLASHSCLREAQHPARLGASFSSAS